MKLRVECALFVMIFGLFLSSSAAIAQTEKLVFPSVDGWDKGKITTYPTKELGYSVVYQSDEGGTVTFYVYNGGLTNIADGIDDTEVKNEIKKAGDDILSYGVQGYYENVAFIKSDTVELRKDSGKNALYSLFTFKLRGTEVFSEIYLIGYKNNFIKIRSTRLKSGESPENNAVKSLLSEISTIFQQ